MVSALPKAPLKKSQAGSKPKGGRSRRALPNPSQALPKKAVLRGGRFEAMAACTFDVVSFCQKHGLKRDQLSRMIAYAPRTVAAWAGGKPVTGAAILKVAELKRLTGALEQLVEPSSLGVWFWTPNQAFDGSMPAHLVERGESDRLWRMIHLLESGQPG